MSENEQDNGSVPPPIKDLGLVSTDEIMDELFRRFDYGVIYLTCRPKEPTAELARNLPAVTPVAWQAKGAIQEVLGAMAHLEMMVKMTVSHQVHVELGDSVEIEEDEDDEIEDTEEEEEEEENGTP